MFAGRSGVYRVSVNFRYNLSGTLFRYGAGSRRRAVAVRRSRRGIADHSLWSRKSSVDPTVLPNRPTPPVETKHEAGGS